MNCALCGRFNCVGNESVPLPDYALCLLNGINIKYPIHYNCTVSYGEVLNYALYHEFDKMDSIEHALRYHDEDFVQYKVLSTNKSYYNYFIENQINNGTVEDFIGNTKDVQFDFVSRDTSQFIVDNNTGYIIG